MTKLPTTATIVEYYNSIVAEDAEFERQIAELQAARSELQIEIKGIQKRFNLNGAAAAIPANAEPIVPKIERPAEKPILDVEHSESRADDAIPFIAVKGKTRRDAAIKIIRESGKWLSAKSLVDYMKKGGLDMSSPSATISLYPVLNKCRELQYVTGSDGVKLYGLREWPLIKSHHKPPTRKRRQWGGKTIGNIVAEFLRVVKQADLDQLMEVTSHQGLSVSRKNLRDSLSRDAHKRFNNTKGIWTLSQSARESVE